MRPSIHGICAVDYPPAFRVPAVQAHRWQRSTSLATEAAFLAAE